MLTAVGVMAPRMGYAADVVVNGQTNTKVTSSSNGATVIQIAPTRSDGSSYNGFSLFNATNPRGTVFNNSLQTTASGAWGTIAGNATLGMAATHIIAEVTGTQASTLSAGLGINGQKASLVLVNPNGISVNGKVVATNVSQATLVVGASNRAGDQVISLDTSKARTGASLTINGALQNPEGALALLSPAIKVATDASVSASNSANLTVAVGQATFDPRSARLLAAEGSAPSSVSVDASLLGAMNAGVINVISTRQGAGVNTSGTWVAQQGIKVDVQGGSLESSNAQFTANGADGISLQASRSLSLNGGKLTGSNIELEGARGVALTNGSINATGNATLHSGGDLALNGYSVNATQNIRATADQHVDMRVLSTTVEVVDPTVSQETSTVNVSGSLGFGLFKPLGINVSGSAKLGANYSAGKSSTTTETVSTLKAGQDVNVDAGGVATLTGTTLTAGGNAQIQGAKAVNLLAAHDSASKNTVSLNLQGGGSVSGVVPYLFGSGTVTLNGGVTGSANGAQTSSTTAKGVSITAGKDVAVQATQGDVLTEGVNIVAGQNALLKASGNVITGVATSTSSSLSETAALKGSVNVPVRVDSGLNILGTLFTGG
ncbi:MAG: hemagglutinin repeat-containing protein, partial [Aquabacterium sp.]|nr:hemagglutinin repeat-containing protein [Aquabacterium sp.]